MAESVFRPNHESKEVRTCPECGAVVEGNRCWLCHRSLTDSGPGISQSAALAPTNVSADLWPEHAVLGDHRDCGVPGRVRGRTGLGDSFGRDRRSGVCRTSAATSAQEQTAGRAVDVPDKVGLFLGSIGVMLLIGLAGFGAFFAACWASCAALSVTGAFRGGGGNSALVWINLFAGGIAWRVVGWLLWKTWPRRNDRWK